MADISPASSSASQTTRLSGFMRRLVEPSVSLPSGQYRQANLLMSFLLVTIAAVSLYQIVYILLNPKAGGITETAGAISVLIVAYMLCRRGYLNASAILIIVLPYLGLLSLVVYSSNPLETLNVMSFVIIPLLASSVFFPPRGVGYVTIFFSIGMLSLIFFAPPITLGNLLSGELSFLWIITGLIQVIARYHSAVEIDRQSELKRSEESLTFALEGSQLGYWDWDIEAGEVQRNARWAEMLGYTLPEIEFSVMQWTDLHHPDDRAAALKSVEDHLQGRTPLHKIEYRMRAKDGQYKWILDCARIVKRDEQGRPLRMSGTHTDITERKLTEEKLAHLHQQNELILDSAAEGILGLDLQGNHIFVNAAAAKMLGYKVEELLGAPSHGIWHHTKPDGSPYPEDECKVRAAYQAGIKQRVHSEVFWRKDGSSFPVEYASTPIYEGSKLTGAVVTFTDVTERKQAEKDLAALHELTQATIDGLSAHVCVLDSRGAIISVNRAWRQFAESNPPVPPDYGVGSNYITVCEAARGDDEKSAQRTAEGLRALLDGRLPEYQIEYPCHSPDEQRWFFLKAAKFESSGALHLVISHENITERKQAEASLLEAERKYRLLVEQSPTVVYIDEIGGHWQYLSPQVEKLLGVTAEELTNNYGMYGKRIHPDDKAAVYARVRECIEQQQRGIAEYRVLNRDNQYVWVHDEMDPSADPVTGKVYLHGIFYDITARKLAEESLQASEAQYRLLAEHMDDVVWLMDIKTNKFAYVSPSVYKLRGYTPEEVMSQPVSESLTPESEELVQQTLMQAFQFVQEGKEIPTVPIQIEQTRKDGTTVWTEAIANFIFDESGFPAQVIGLSRDVTEHKRVEAALRESESRFSNMFQSSPIGIALTDILSAEMFDVNDAFADIWGYPRNELIGHTTDELNLWEFPAERKAALKDLMQTDSIKNYTIHAIKKSGDRILVKFSAEIIDLAGRKYLLGNYEDITEQAEANKRLRESELRFRQMAENIHEVFWIFDRQTYKHVYANPAYEAMFDVNQETLNNDPDFFVKKVMPEDQPVVLAALEKQKRGENTETEYRIRRADGSLRWIWDRSFPVHDENGKLVRTAGVATDITERKQAGDEMRRRMLELEMLYESGLALNRMTSPGQIGEKIIELLEQKMDWHHTLIRLYHPQDTTLEIIALNLPDVKSEHERRAAKERMNSRVSKSGEGLSGWVVQNGQTVRSSNVRADPRYEETYPGICSGLYVPIKLGENAIGVISIESEKPDAFNEADERLVATLSNQAAIAIENARLNSGLEQRVRERTAEVQDLYENAPTGYHSLDANGVIIMINQTELNWLGYAREEIAGIKKFRDLCMPHSQQIFDENFPRFKAQGWINDLEFDVMRKDGSVFPVLLNATAVYDANGKFLNSRSTTFDITVRKHAEEAARKLSQAVEHSPVSVVIANRDGVIEYVNPRFCEATGYTRNEIVGQNPRILKSGIHPPEFYETMWATLLAGNPWHGELCNKRKNGELFWEYASIAPVRNEHGETTHYVAVKEDVTERKKAESQREAALEALRESRDELSAANMALEKAARLKDEFLASMSHELRTPLTGILGFSEVLQLRNYGELNEKQYKAVKNIEDSGRHLLELINDILDLSKIEAGKLQLQFAPCSLADACQASLQLTKGMAQQKKQTVHYAPASESVTVRADARRLKQILVNLLGNAIKFTPENGELGLEVQIDEDGRRVKLIVWDKGIGMRSEDFHKIFKPFMQLDSSLAREYSGTGLGLSLVRRLTEMHNGGIKVESVLGAGSRFTISLPWSPQNTTPILDAPPRRLDARPAIKDQVGQSQFPLVMLADDNELVLQMIADFLEMEQYRIVKVRSGAELLERAAEMRPDIMLVDIQMPGMDGLETIRRIRTHTDAAVSSAPIIAITALAMPGDRELCLAAGANEYMSKPVRLTELAEVVHDFIVTKNQ